MTYNSNLISETPVKFEVALPEELTVQENEEFTLTATLSKDKPITWSKNDKPINTDDTHYQMSNVETTHTLHVDKARQDDEAVFTLTVDNKKCQTNVTVEGMVYLS